MKIKWIPLGMVICFKKRMILIGSAAIMYTALEKAGMIQNG